MLYQLATSHETLAKKILIIPSSIAICERGFSKQNAIKSHLRASLKFECFVVSIIMQIDTGNTDWKIVFDL